MTNKLMHTGVKGMRWGVRKLEEEHGVLVRRKGETVDHISKYEDLKLQKGGLYVSFKESDVAKYRAQYGFQIQSVDNVKKIFDHKLTLAEDLVSPDKKRRIDELIQLHKNDKNIVKTMAEDKVTATFFLSTAKAFGFDRTQAKADEYRKLLDSKNPKDQEKAFHNFSSMLPLSDRNRKRYFESLESKGFNSIYDDNDILSGYTKSPMIVFNPQITLKLTSKSLVPQSEIDEGLLKDD